MKSTTIYLERNINPIEFTFKSAIFYLEQYNPNTSIEITNMAFAEEEVKVWYKLTSASTSKNAYVPSRTITFKEA